MKTLENLKKYQLKEDMIDIKGGAAAAHVSGSFKVGGSLCTYDGTLELTGETTGIATVSVTNHVKDFCGTTSADGVGGANCGQYINGEWKPV